jgi:hypothetical protein
MTALQTDISSGPELRLDGQSPWSVASEPSKTGITAKKDPGSGRGFFLH